MSAITKHTEEINEKHLENMKNLRSKTGEREVSRVYVEPKIDPCEFTFFINQPNRHTYTYNY